MKSPCKVEHPCLIETVGVSVERSGHTVLENIHLRVGRGEIVTLVGPNGSGKTSLLRVLMGALQPIRGKVIRSPQLEVGYVPQRLNLEIMLPMTVERFMHLPVKQPSNSVYEALEKTGAASLINRQVMRLSGGQFQRVLMARALLREPNLLLLDEATQGLDQAGIADFYSLLATLRKEIGCSVLMVSHDLNVVMRQTDRVICLNKHICCQGRPDHVSASPEYRQLFGSGEAHLALYHHHLSNSSSLEMEIGRAG